MSGSLTRKFVLHGEAETRALGAAVSDAVEVGDVICLSGELGSGKTTFARGLIGALLDKSDQEDTVVSPTFTLVQSYEVHNLTVYHFDLYRVQHETELVELGFDEAVDSGLVIVEWPERLGGWLPEERLAVELTGAGEQRRAGITGHGAWASRLGIMLLESAGREVSGD